MSTNTNANTNAHSDDRRIDLGHGLEVSRLGFGGMAITHVYGETDPAKGSGPSTTPSMPGSPSSTPRTSTVRRPRV